jgi:hypothetical protein
MNDASRSVLYRIDYGIGLQDTLPDSIGHG